MRFFTNSRDFFITLATVWLLSISQSNCSSSSSGGGGGSFHPRKLASGSSCPMNFSVLHKFLESADEIQTTNISRECQYVLQGLRLVQAEYLRTDGMFVPPPSVAQACWDAYQAVAEEFAPNFDIRSSCGFETSWISERCMNISTRAEFESLVSNSSSLQNVQRTCNQSLQNNSPCASCTTRLSVLQASSFNGKTVGNVSDCADYPFIYAAGVVNSLGPTDAGTALCLFLLQSSSPSSSSSSGGKSYKGVVAGAVVGCLFALLLVVLGALILWRKRRRRWKMKNMNVERSLTSRLDSISASTTLVNFTFEEIKMATRNFSRDNIIGKGGYGNVYKGILSNGMEVALKRFKNCSAAGDASFVHEVEVIASVRHVNLVALRGYCIATTSLEGHQRIIVCDLMHNGSLYDHLFGSDENKLSWPTRQKIAIEKSDVYGFGVLLLELLSGRKALVSMTEGQTWLVTDWAWSLVRKGRALDVIEESMPELGPREVLEKYVLVAVLASHPQLHARPTMDQIVKILETDLPVPLIPERPISIVANMDDIERSVSGSGSGNLSSSAGYQPFTAENDHVRSDVK
ncbi:hypothetical protein ACLOJK_018104 [Asimina triloba]